MLPVSVGLSAISIEIWPLAAAAVEITPDVPTTLNVSEATVNEPVPLSPAVFCV